jgi:hypothetical protein
MTGRLDPSHLLWRVNPPAPQPAKREATQAGSAYGMKGLTRPVTDTVDTLILDLLEWLGTSPRPYDEVLDAWRTSCPRLPVWEEANARGFIERNGGSGTEQTISVSRMGADHLRLYRLQASHQSYERPQPLGQ